MRRNMTHPVHPPVPATFRLRAISRSCPVETQRQYNLTQRRREGVARSVIVQTYLGLIATVTGIDHSFVILNLFQDNEPRSHVILKQVQDDELWGEEVGSTPFSGMTHLSPEFVILTVILEYKVFRSVHLIGAHYQLHLFRVFQL